MLDSVVMTSSSVFAIGAGEELLRRRRRPLGADEDKSPEVPWLMLAEGDGPDEFVWLRISGVVGWAEILGKVGSLEEVEVSG